MKLELELVLGAFLLCSIADAAIDSRGVQTFENGSATEDVQTSAVTSAAATTTLKPLPQTYTVVDWKRYYPFGDKFPDSNHTASNDTKPDKTEKKIVFPMYVKVPIRVPVKAAYRKPEKPKIVMPRTVRGAKPSPYHLRFKAPPRYMMLRQMKGPMRRKFIAYYPKPYYYKRQYIKPMYHKTGIHDYYKKNVYYPLKAYEVTEPKAEGLKEWYDPGNAKLSNNLV